MEAFEGGESVVYVCERERERERKKERKRERERHRRHLLRIVLQHFAERWRPLRGMPRPLARDACMRVRAETVLLK